MSGRQLRDTFDLDLAEATRSGRLIRGVGILGKISENGRIYRRTAQEDVVEHIRDGRDTVYSDHPEDGKSAVRPTASVVGVLENVRLAGDIVRGDLKVADSPPWNTLVPWIAEEAPTAAGMSIRARGTVRQAEDGTRFVERVQVLEAVELVTEPATVGALVESVQRGRREQIVAVLEEGDVDPVCLGVFVRWAAQQPDGVEQARQFVREFDRAVDPRDRGRGGSLAVAPERDPDVILEESARRRGGRRPVTPEALEEASTRLFN